MRTPKISIIIPVYNKAPFIRRCFDSFATQNLENVQVIVVDDGSTDGSSEICDEYKKYGFEVYHRKNGGVSVARNFGMSKAKGEFITFMDADDAYTEDAIEVLLDSTTLGENIVQFGQLRHMAIYPQPVIRNWGEGRYSMWEVRRYWAMVWNKIYNREFISKLGVKFKKGMQFGEDELFNAVCIIANNGVYHSSCNLVHHYFDDNDSLCRGGLCLERLEKMDEAECELVKELKADGNENGASWLWGVINRHRNSDLFKQYGFKKKNDGSYDIVYFVKECESDEELRYSLRSVEENWQYKSVWFYGGCPKGLKPDHHVIVSQNQMSKWENVRKMLVEACKNDEITENFWLFNDDFFVIKPVSEDMQPQINGTLEAQIERVERRHGGFEVDYTKRLRHLVRTLRMAGKGTLNYSVHKPILVNRKKALEVLEKFPDEPMFRALYGNYWDLGGEDKSDNKIMVPIFDLTKLNNWRFVSTDDESFRAGGIGRWIRDRFKNKSSFEV